ncbi:MAG: hypothetical protein HY738_02340 [Bacteroidia bacterium]|nr:hypothetical protein [Bacteroidia bacterium]
MNTEIIHKIIELLKGRAGLNIKLALNPVSISNKTFDGYIKIILRAWNFKCIINIKNNLTPNYIIEYKEFVKEKKIKHPIVVITSYIYPKLREQLRNQNIAYIDLAGNTFLKQNAFFFYIYGNSKQTEAINLKSRIFTYSGLKILFYLLYDPDNINKTYREIAVFSNTSLDSVHKTINSLIQMNYILKINKDTCRLINTKTLIEKWIQDYDMKMKTKLFCDTFRFLKKEDEYNWRKIKFKTPETYWGGEAAGALLTNYLHPEIFTIYSNETIKDLVKNYRFYPDSGGKIKIYQKFWNFAHHKDAIVPELLIYTDLINTNDERCLEAANIIYNKYLADRFKKYS